VGLGVFRGAGRSSSRRACNSAIGVGPRIRGISAKCACETLISENRVPVTGMKRLRCRNVSLDDVQSDRFRDWVLGINHDDLWVDRKKPVQKLCLPFLRMRISAMWLLSPCHFGRRACSVRFPKELHIRMLLDALVKFQMIVERPYMSGVSILASPGRPYRC
jgi:hypothetical protein